ncbi:MAG: hypothetical protein V1806_15395 [Pseudomonadota bacterium]
MTSDHKPPQAPPPPADATAPAGEDRLLGAVRSLFQGLAPFMAPLPPGEFQRLVGGGLAQALGQALAPQQGQAAGQPAAPTAPAVEERTPSPDPAAAPPPGLAGLGQEGPVGPPGLPPAELVLEERLALSAHPQYQGEAWWERTMYLMVTWNQMRRRLGHLSPQFPRLGAHWQQPDWPDFDQARRQADAQGADYEHWVAAQYQRPGRQDLCQAPLPQELHGPQAQLAWREFQEARRVQASRPDPDAPPFAPGEFDLYNPRHVAHAQKLLDEIMGLAAHVYGGDPQGTALLLAQALERGNLPPQALELVPQLKDRVLALATQPRPAG